ncbi:type IV secretion system protein [Paracraurococcus lichenis]|uniref:Type IV secretion system protein n=1 Tax=Paracraurococcus lichenis TaxID=3064888 RepID=A0ABT9E8Q8_9PROT|nr:type IV secretion system protein [Paracraurococcus sp. LOR1-02]MDO9712546.1 type IV secretion system protein [Paracraurococcus sp. LOR1-02]
MRRMLLATAAALALAGPAWAQGIPVYDNASIIQTATAIAKDAAYWAKQAAQMKSQLDQAIGIYNGITGPRPLYTIGGVLANFDLQLPGISNFQIANALQGNFTWGDAAALARGNTYAEPTGDDPEAREMALRRLSLANLQQDARDAIAAAEARVLGISALRAKASATADLKESADLQARIAAEEAALQNDTGRAQRMQLLATTQARVDEMRDRELARLSAATWYDNTKEVWDVRW